MRRWLSALSVGSGLVLMLIGAIAWAQQASPSEQAAPESRQPAGQESPSPQSAAEAELLHVLVGHSLEVTSPEPIKQFSVSSPGIIDVAVEDSHHIKINGKATGGVSLQVMNEAGESQIFYVYVDLDASAQAGQLPEAPIDNQAPAHVEKKASRAWLGWALFASVFLLAGAVLTMRRRRQPAAYRLDLQTAKAASGDGRAEPAPARTGAARDERPHTEETVTAAETRPAEIPEEANRGLRELWSRQLQEQAEAGSERLREQLRDLQHVVEESKQQLASLADAKLAFLMQAVRDEYGRQLAQSTQERAQTVQEAAEAGVKSIKQAAGEAIAQFEAAEQKRETTYQRLAQTFQEQTQTIHEAADAYVKSIRQAAEEAIAQWQAATQNNEAGILQAREAVGQLREEMKNSGQFVEGSKLQLASLAESKLAAVDEAGAYAVTSLETAVAKLREEFDASERMLAESRDRLAGFVEARIALLSQVASSGVTDLEVEQVRFRRQLATSRKEPEDLFTRRSAYQSAAFDDKGSSSNRRGVTAAVAVGAGLFLVVAAQQLGVFFSTPPPIEMHLQAEAPSDFADENPSWSVKRRVEEEEMARDYWRAAAFSLQRIYPYGSQLPADPPPEFQVDNQSDTTGGAASAAKTRAHYWEKFRACWGQRRFWVESQSQPVKETWADRLRGAWARN